MKYCYSGELTGTAIFKLITRHRSDKSKIQANIDHFLGKKLPVKELARKGMANNKLNVNWSKYITDTSTGYFVGIPPTYSTNDKAFDAIKKVYDANDETTINYEIGENMSICGFGFDLTYIGSENETCIVNVDPLTAFLICDDDVKHNARAGVRYWYVKNSNGSNKLKGELYLPFVTRLFETKAGKIAFTEDIVTPFSAPNLTLYRNNRFLRGDYDDATLTLINGYNKLQSNVSDDLENTANAYLVLKGYEQPDDDDLKVIREERVLGIPEPDGDAKYITKDLSDDVIQNHRKSLKEDMLQIAGVPDLSDDSFSQAASGVSLEHKLYGLNQLWAKKKASMEKALFARMKLVAEALNFFDSAGIGDVTEMVAIKFYKNLPRDTANIIDNAVKVDGVASQRTVCEMLEPATGVTADDEQKRLKDEELETDYPDPDEPKDNDDDDAGEEQ